ncbi:MAG: N-glycosylase/DNA lyase [Candidatus Peribacteria bacterium]|nr:MAG: N-glycosylase/DNA lyase [Candidatus Peribacteria bacterium]
MTGFNDLLGEIMNQKNYAKTITFGTKMFGYGCRIIFEELIYFPFEVAIPVDSRLTQIYQCMHNTQESYSTYILSYYNQLGKKYDLPPLHLDSLLRIKYRDTYFTKYRGA